MTSTFKDNSSDCAICLSPLSESLCLTLTCGHIYHKVCLLIQLSVSKPDPSRRLLFNGCLCAKCKAFCDHPELESATRHSRTLLSQVDELVRQVAPSAVDIATQRRLYAFYLCSDCEKPFFGGTVECEEDSARHEIPPQERICSTCVASTTAVPCADPAHTPYHVWKCRLCCSPADRVCFGRTHFCESCHARFSIGDESARECTGLPTCVHPMVGTAQRHVNDLDVAGEQLLFCAACKSSASGNDNERINYSRNLLCNPAGEDGLTGWTQLQPSERWAVEASETPYPPFVKNFVSTYSLCVMAQTVDMRRFVRTWNDDLTISVSARYRARTDCPSIFVLEASVLDDESNEVFHVTTDELSAPPDCWEVAQHTFRLGRGRYVVVRLSGKDSKFWAGWYGSKVTDCRVSVVLGDAAEEEVLNEATMGVDDRSVRAVQTFWEQLIHSFSR